MPHRARVGQRVPRDAGETEGIELMKNPFVTLWFKLFFARIFGVHWWQVREVK